MKKNILSWSIICLIVTAGCKSNPTSAKDEKVADKVVNPNVRNVGNENYTVDIPISWSTKTEESGGYKLLEIKSPITSNDSSNVYINILTESMHGNSIDDYREATIKNIVENMPGTIMLDKGDIAAGDLRGK